MQAPFSSLLGQLTVGLLILGAVTLCAVDASGQARTQSLMAGSPIFENGVLQTDRAKITLGEFGVGRTGAATFAIPIMVPPGTAGMQPNLSLTYSSQAANGLIGVGWRLTGLSMITRCRQTIAQDGWNGTITFSASDRFCLDGQRLVAISGTYGANGTEYRTEKDTFVKVISHGSEASGPQYFTVKTKEGRTLEYGHTSDSRIEAAGSASARVWALNDVQDTNGNRMTVSYHESDGDFRPAGIEYTTNAGGGLTQPSRRVLFSYETRTDVPMQFVSGAKIEMKYRLTSIKTFAKVGGTEEQVRDYRITYDPSTTYTSRSRVRTITECVTSRCYDHEPFELEWSDTGAPSGNFQKTSQSIDFGSVVNGDFNGDGRADFLAKPGTNFTVFLSIAGEGGEEYASGADWGSGIAWDAKHAWRGDFDGDGLTDMLTNVGNTFYTYFSTGMAFGSAANGGSGRNEMQQWGWTGDFNGDGRTDILTVNAGGNEILTHLSQGDGNYTQYIWPLPAGSPPAKLSGDKDRFWIGDIDGDKMADLVTYKSDNLHIYRSRGDGTYSHSTFAVSDAEWAANFAWVGDYNGDGLVDLVSKKDLEDDFNTYFSEGDGTFAVVRYTTPAGAGWGRKNVWVGDFNGDGFADLMSKKNGYFYKYFSKGNGEYAYFGAEAFSSGQFDDNMAWTGDVNGDGLLDLVSYAGNATYTYFTDETFPDLLTAITNPLKGAYLVTYASLADAEVYTKDDQAVYPTVDAAVPIYVVAGYTASNGCEDNDDCGRDYDFTYGYEGLKFDLEGRGNLGFQTVRMRDLSGTNIARETHYRQDFPFEGLVDIVAVSDSSDGRLLQEVHNTWAEHHPGVSHPAVFAALEAVDTLECDGAVNCRTVSRTMEYDEYGNHEKTVYEGILSKTGDEYEEETVWAVDQSNWLHRPIMQTVKDFDGSELRRSWFYYDGNNTNLGQLGTRGLRTREEQDLGGGQGHTDNPKTTVVYDAFGNRQSVTDPLGCITSWAYDSTKTFPVSEKTCLADNNSQATATSEWDERWGVELGTTDANGNRTEYRYADSGRIEKVIGPLDNQFQPLLQYSFAVSSHAKNHYASTQRPILHGAALTLRKYEYFDGLGRVWFEKTRGPQNLEVSKIIEYDSRNLVKSFSDLRQWSLALLYGYEDFTTYIYDPLGRLTEVLFPDRTSIRTSYAPDPTTKAMVIEVTDQLGHKKRRFIDAYGHVIKVEEDNVENGSRVTYVTEYTYNALGQLLTTANHLGHVSAIEYDKLGRKTVHADPDTGEWDFTEYDKAGNLKEQRDANGNTITFAYDVAGRVTQKTYGGGAGTIIWEYDDPSKPNSAGRLTKVTDLVGTETYGYDEMGRVREQARTIGSKTYTIQQTWNALNRLDAKTYPDGDTVTFTYNTAGWLRSISGVIHDVRYNPRGQITYMRFDSWTRLNREYYDGSFRLKTSIIDGVQDLEYEYDAKGNVTRITDYIGSAGRDFRYDELDRLVEASGTFGGTNQANVIEAYGYDAVGNFTEKAGTTYHYDGESNRVQTTTVGGVVQKTFAYDANGNMTRNGTEDYEWDKDNRLISVNGSVGFSYGYTGRRLTKDSVLYPFPGYEVDSRGVQKKYFTVNGELVGVKKDNGAPAEYRFYHTDHLGGTHVITGDDGLIDQILEYDPWGRISRASSALDNVKKFTGQEYDDETDLYYYVGRYYDPQLGRFIQPDPFVGAPFNPQNLNRYSYVLNNPVNFTDPSGFDPFANENGQFSIRGPNPGPLLNPAATLLVFDFSYTPDILGNGGGEYGSNTGLGGGIPLVSRADIARGLLTPRLPEVHRPIGGTSRWLTRAGFLAGATLYQIGNFASTGVGVASELGQRVNVAGGYWHAPKVLKDGTRPWYPLSFAGNGATGGRLTAFARQALWKNAAFIGFSFGALGTGLGLIDGQVGPVRASADLLFGAVGLTGTPGFFVALTYVGLTAISDYYGIDMDQMAKESVEAYGASERRRIEVFTSF